MFKMYTKKSTSRKNIFQQLKKNKLPYLVTLFQSQLLRNWAEQSKFWWIFFYEKSFYLSNKKRMRSWASILKKLEGGRLFASCTCRVVLQSRKKFVRKIFEFFFTEFFAYNIDVGDHDGRMQTWFTLLCLDITRFCLGWPLFCCWF